MEAIYSMEAEKLKRTRAKTPCLWIGHLDSQPRIGKPTVPDASALLAGQYQALLPPRTFTPLPDTRQSTSFHRPLRKIKGRMSLRDSVICEESVVQREAQEAQEAREASVHSDAETLVGTPSLGSPTSRTFSIKSCKEYLDLGDEERGSFTPVDEEEKDVGFKICLDLLTSELATGLSKKHPTESLDRASGLQILLMIEAYEAVQHAVKLELSEGHVTADKLAQVKELEQTLSNWLGALNMLYDRTQSIKSDNDLRKYASSLSDSPTEPLRNLSHKQSFRSDLGRFDFDFVAAT